MAKKKSKAKKSKTKPKKAKKAVRRVKKAPRAKAKKAAKKRRAKKPAKKAAPKVPANYERIGIITHYFPHVQAGVIKIAKGKLSVGDQIHIKGATTDFKQEVQSLQINHVPVPSVKKGDDVGIQTAERVRQHDVVYRIKP